MMERSWWRLVFALALLYPALGAAEPQGAREFLEGLYSQYTDPSASPDVLGDKAAAIFAPALLRLIRQDQKRADGEVGKLDGDPICDCQDYTISGVQVDMGSETARSAKATVHFLNFGNPQTVRFELVRVQGDWRIADIGEDEVPSLRAFLAKPDE